MPPPSILWLRRDLRRGDLPALGAAHDAATGAPDTPDGHGEVAVLFVLDPTLWEVRGTHAGPGWPRASRPPTRRTTGGCACGRATR